eukprot:7385406-Prymnesium_polylepis.1
MSSCATTRESSTARGTEASATCKFRASDAIAMRRCACSTCAASGFGVGCTCRLSEKTANDLESLETRWSDPLEGRGQMYDTRVSRP